MMEVIKGELGRFAMNKGEGLQEMYNMIKTLVILVRNYESIRWTNHEFISLMLRPFSILRITLSHSMQEP
jgi:hypothetical protein